MSFDFICLVNFKLSTHTFFDVIAPRLSDIYLAEAK